MFIDVTLPLLILSLLSFNSYGTPNDGKADTFRGLPVDVQGRIIAEAISNDPQTVFSLSQVNKNIRKLTNDEVEKNVHFKALRDLQNNRDSWIKTAKQAGIDDNEPDHLLEILEVEKRLFANLLERKESTIGNDPVKWKKHTLATMLSYSAAWNAANNAARNAARNATWNAANNAARNAANNAADNAAWNAANNAARNAANNAADNAARNAAWNAARQHSWNAACNAVKGLSCPNETGRVAYRVAETQAWITFLDPSLKTLEKAYDAAYSNLNDIPEENLGDWFSSQEDFESKLNEYFVNREGFNDRSKQFLEHLLDHLNRMIPKMFPSNEI